jgi:hypothetical protein
MMMLGRFSSWEYFLKWAHPPRAAVPAAAAVILRNSRLLLFMTLSFQMNFFI